MSNFMQLQVFEKGALYSADCQRCGQTQYSHEWFHGDNNDRRDAMQAGTLGCDECGASVDPATFRDCGRQYAARYSAPGYLDCTDVHYGKNIKMLKREVREMYGD